VSQQPSPVPAPSSHPSASPGTPGATRARPGEALRGLARARRTLALYSSDHPVTARAIVEAFQVLDAMLQSRANVRLFIHEDTFYMGRTLLLEESLRLGSLLTDLGDRQIGTIEFQAGLESWELQRLVEALTLRPPELQRLGGAAQALRQRDVRHIVVSSGRPMLPDERAQIRVDPRDIYRAGLRVVDDLYFQASHEMPLDMKKASMLLSTLLDVMMEDRAALLGIAALQYYDEATAHHSINVTILALLTGMQLGLDRGELMTLGLTALLHDIGKVRLPRELLAKAGAWTDAERDQMRRHTLYGAHLLRTLPGPARLAMVVAFEHHANFNLSGYPQITAKPVPHALTRIVGVADFFDAATRSPRPGRPPMLAAEAMGVILDHAGTAFDPTVVRAFREAVGQYPVGSLVELSTGPLAVVTRPGTREPDRPVVKIVTDASGARVDGYTVALEESPDIAITGVIDPAETQVDVTAYFQA
jgi:putative nucleotidyltransferase with HDIG domain